MGSEDGTFLVVNFTVILSQCLASIIHPLQAWSTFCNILNVLELVRIMKEIFELTHIYKCHSSTYIMLVYYVQTGKFIAGTRAGSRSELTEFLAGHFNCFDDLELSVVTRGRVRYIGEISLEEWDGFIRELQDSTIATITKQTHMARKL